jgi:hypothetical protein
VFPTIQASFNLERLGLFVLPGESEAEYQIRASSIAETKNGPAVLLKDFGSFPTWIEIIYKDEGLSLWEAGCLWYSDDRLCPPLLQLRSLFLSKETLYSLYSKGEIIAHECVHAIRAPLGCERFEEYFAYCTAKSAFRMFIGPLFSNPREVSFVIFFCLILMLCAFLNPMISIIGTCTIFSLLFARLARNWYLFFKCKERLSFFTNMPLALMIRLTDEEIFYFAKYNHKECARWIEEQKEQNFRWQLLFFLATHSEFWQASTP